MRNILVSGATGSLGKCLIPMLIKNDFNVTILTRSPTKTTHIKTLIIDSDLIENIKKAKPHFILHLASDYGRNGLNLELQAQTNIQFPLRLLQAAIEMTTPPIFINTDTSLHSDVSPYSLFKSQFRQWLIYYKNDIKIVNIVMENFYGVDNNQFVSIMMSKIKNQVKEIDLTLGTQKRDFIHIDDVVTGFEKILTNTQNFTKSYTNFEIGSGKSITIRHLLQTMQEVAGYDQTNLNWGAIPFRKHEQMLSKVNTSLLKSLNWEAKVSLKEGLQKLGALL